MSGKGFAELDAMIARIRELPRMAQEAAPEVAEALRDHLEQNIAAGRSPEGASWKPTRDGKKPLAGATKALSVRAVGAIILAVLSGHEVYHHYGTKRVPRRAILPSAALPEDLSSAIKAGLVRRFRRRMGGR
ncbi:phage virion morphogenesis protein [Chondromyces crocatus]|uniref:Phage virion morphogenesis protein n=1 Tax=Chondromyces crocatus TaxID=52 RepID=A0A0K1EC53_CHOCO|nr:phage virion morphogenesis protein [Chondromyces crocatus]AKT38257.1 uncharacterized protein CMC5_024000 [Chondromyces crocatus]